MAGTVQLDYYGPRRVASAVRVRPSLFSLTFGRCLLGVAGTLMACVHFGLLWLSRALSFGPGPPPPGPRNLHEFVIHYAWIAMVAGGICAILRLPRRAYACCTALALPALTVAASALGRGTGIVLGYGAYGVVVTIGFVWLARAADGSGHSGSPDHRALSPLPGLALIWSALASPVGLFLVALYAIDPVRSEMKVVAWVFLVALPVSSFAFSAIAWSHLDKNGERLRGRAMATVAWAVSSLSLIVGLCVGIGMLC